jgi:hypothetical protein
MNFNGEVIMVDGGIWDGALSSAYKVDMTRITPTMIRAWFAKGKRVLSIRDSNLIVVDNNTHIPHILNEETNAADRFDLAMEPSTTWICEICIKILSLDVEKTQKAREQFYEFCASFSPNKDMYEVIALGVVWLEGTLAEGRDEEVAGLLLDSDGEWSEEECRRFILLQLLPFFLNNHACQMHLKEESKVRAMQSQ